MPEGGQTAAELLAEGVLLERMALYDRARERYHAAAAAPEPEVRAEALRRESDVCRARCQWHSAIERARESAYIAEKSGLTDLLTEALNAEGLVLVTRGEIERATALFHRMLALTRTDRIRGIALQNLGTAAATRGLFAEAEVPFEESQECFERASYMRGIAMALNNRVRLALLAGDVDRATQACGAAVAAAQRVEDMEYVAVATLNSAECYAFADDYRRAEDLASTALGYFTVAENHWRRVECLRLFGDIRLRQRDPATAERAYRNGLELARAIGARVEEQVLVGQLESLLGPGELM